MSRPSISIITASYNQAEFIERTITSILDQNYPDLQYIVVDGGSDDGTLEILRRYEDRLTWTSEPDNGQSDAINKGLRQATGDIVAFLNSDDMYPPGTLDYVADVFTSRPEIGWLTGGCQIIDADDHPIRPLIARYKDVWLRWPRRESLLVTNYISQPSTFWRRSVMEQVGYLDESLHQVMDYEYWLRLWSVAELAVVPRTLSMFRIHGESKTGQKAMLTQRYHEQLTTAQKYTTNRGLLAIQRLHNAAIVTVYGWL
jgi:glycosyltransferase involved in cell wall biosynthesis